MLVWLLARTVVGQSHVENFACARHHLNTKSILTRHVCIVGIIICNKDTTHRCKSRAENLKKDVNMSGQIVCQTPSLRGHFQSTFADLKVTMSFGEGGRFGLWQCYWCSFLTGLFATCDWHFSIVNREHILVEECDVKGRGSKIGRAPWLNSDGVVLRERSR